MNTDLNNTFLIQNIASKNYYEYCKLQKKLIIADMKHIFVFTFNTNLFYVKTRVNNEIVFPDKGFLKTFKNIVVWCDDKSMVNLWIIFESGVGTTVVKNWFYIHNVTFDFLGLHVRSLFQGYPYESTCTFNRNIIQPFLDHILNIICDHVLDLNSFIIY
jgi:hypothetical protein